jgi:glycosyltransferase involved in cell wall biosynthesis
MMQSLVHQGEAGARLVIAGAGPLQEWMHSRLAGTLEGRVLLCGNLDRDTLAQYLASCDVFVHPNPKEPFGIGPLEAMASGVPVVLPRAGGVLEYACDDNAWLAEPTAAAFARAARAAWRGDPVRVENAVATAERFGWRAAARRYFDTYDDIHQRITELRRSSATSARRRLASVNASRLN